MTQLKTVPNWNFWWNDLQRRNTTDDIEIYDPHEALLVEALLAKHPNISLKSGLNQLQLGKER